MAFSQIYLTDQGKDLLARAQAGETLRFTRAEIGDGDLNGRAIDKMTDLIHKIAGMNIDSISFEEPGKTLVQLQFTNHSIQESFYWREIGLYASGQDGDEILYAYGNAEKSADLIPDFASSPTEFLYRIVINTANAQNITASIDQSLLYVTKEELKVNGRCYIAEEGNLPEMNQNDICFIIS